MPERKGGAMKNRFLSKKKYAALLADIRAIIQEGKDRAARAVEQELVVTYWQVGKRIAKETSHQQAGPLKAVLDDVAEELLLDGSTLLRCVQLFHAYPKGIAGSALNWSQYKLLLPMDQRERKWYQAQALENNWNVRKLNQAIRHQAFEAEKHSRGGALRRAARSIKRPTQATYVYKAIVEHVVDGDTLLVRLDLGFTTWKEQRLRLASIDTPALDEPKGPEAAAFVEQELAPCEFVMVKTNKIDIYGRYVAHVFYRKGETDKATVFERGTYLNQKLLDRGLAIVF
jgi:endonuclease YncB( thermonuclease family)